MHNFPEDLVAAWLNRQDAVLSRSGQPTWNVLLHALEAIGQKGIAQDVREYCNTRKLDYDSNAFDHHGSPLSPFFAGINFMISRVCMGNTNAEIKLATTTTGP